MPDRDLWAMWPDDFMCPLCEVHEFGHRSDDYMIVNVLEYSGEDGEPTRWERAS